MVKRLRRLKRRYWPNYGQAIQRGLYYNISRDYARNPAFLDWDIRTIYAPLLRRALNEPSALWQRLVQAQDKSGLEEEK